MVTLEIHIFPFWQELLELGDRIGYVNTGLREEEISRSLRKMKHSILDASPLYFSTEMEKKCSICQVGFLMLLLLYHYNSIQLEHFTLDLWGRGF